MTPVNRPGSIWSTRRKGQQRLLNTCGFVGFSLTPIARASLVLLTPAPDLLICFTSLIEIEHKAVVIGEKRLIARRLVGRGHLRTDDTGRQQSDLLEQTELVSHRPVFHNAATRKSPHDDAALLDVDTSWWSAAVGTGVGAAPEHACDDLVANGDLMLDDRVKVGEVGQSIGGVSLWTGRTNAVPVPGEIGREDLIGDGQVARPTLRKPATCDGCIFFS